MKISVLADNKAFDGFNAEHGLSLFVCHNNRNILIDAGRSSLFAENASKLGVDLKAVELAILSHSHYDHSDGFETFFEINSKAMLYSRIEAGEIYYSMHEDGLRYIGPCKGMLKKYRSRIHFVKTAVKSLPEYKLFLLKHSLSGYSHIGSRYGLFRMEDKELLPDDFSHEQTAVFETDKGLVIINSCSHAGPLNILNELEALGLNKPVYAYIGGFHLIKADDSEIFALADRLKNASVSKIYTGHCTGDRAFDILKCELGDKIEQLHSGMVIDI